MECEEKVVNLSDQDWCIIIQKVVEKATTRVKAGA